VQLVTREARLGLNGPQVIEQEAGLDEYDSRDRPFIWSLTGGEQRFASGLVDRYVADDVAQLQQTVSALLQQGLPAQQRSRQAAHYLRAWPNWTPCRKSTRRRFAICIKENAHEWFAVVQRIECRRHAGDRVAGLAESRRWRIG
jgi:hypothetical protein